VTVAHPGRAWYGRIRVTTMRSMPPEVQQLRGEWPSQVERIPNLTEELEKDFRFGQRISKTDRGYFMGGPIKGGTSSMWYPSTKDEYKAYTHWKKVEGVVEGRDDEALERLLAILRPHEIALATKHKAQSRELDPEPFAGFGPLYHIVATVLEALPPHHLARPELERIQLGGWGPDGAKASAYHQGTVLMYDFAIRGARRTFEGLLLHELGHAHEQALTPRERDALFEAYKVLAAADAFMGVEFLLDSSTRILYQKFVFAEFLAETYMVYAACGARLRQFIREQAPDVRAAWDEVYRLFREGFGVEYE
jgi:hypothetical protein